MYRNISVEQTDNNIYIFFGFIAVIVFIITAYYIKSCYDCKSEDNCCQRGDLKIFCSADCTLETDPRAPEVDCVGQWGEWGECSVGCTDDGSGSGIQSRSYSIMVNSENNGNECPENEGTTMTRVCNDGLLCHNDCEGSWEITNCQVEGIDVICGPSERTYTFTTTIPPINDGETCLERYGSEIPEYIRGELPDGDLLNSTTVTEQCDNSSASDLPVSYISRDCGECDLGENNISANKACVPKICGELPLRRDSQPLCLVSQNRKKHEEIGFDAATCCFDKTCEEWDSDNDCNGGTTLTNGDMPGFTQDDCCRPLTCAEWFADEGDCNEMTSTTKSGDVVGNTVVQCCEPKTCQEIKDYIKVQQDGDEYCPGNIRYSIEGDSRRSNSFVSGLGVCYKPSFLSLPIPVGKLEGYQWEKICCGPSKIEEQNRTEQICAGGLNDEGECIRTTTSKWVKTQFEAGCSTGWPDCIRGGGSLPGTGECPEDGPEEIALQSELNEKLRMIKIRDPNFRSCDSSLMGEKQIMGGCNEGGTSSNPWYTNNVIENTALLYSLLKY